MKNPTLLLVDDDLAVLAALTNVLRSKGHVVIDASNGKEALEFAATHPEIELVLLDLNMPQNGWEVLQQLKADPAPRAGDHHHRVAGSIS